jgi:hypothetical protein
MKSRVYSRNVGDSSLDVIQSGTIERRENTENVDDTPNQMLRCRESFLLNDMERAIDDVIVPQNSGEFKKGI